MKILALGFLLTLLSGCAVVDKVTQYWPRDHDPAMVSKYVDLATSLEKVTCAEQSSLDEPIKLAEWLNKYSEFRADPQAVTTTNVVTNLKQAKDSSEAACKRWVNLANINMKNIKESWSAR